MGQMDGHTQVCLYIPEELLKMAKLVAIKTDRPLYKLVSESLVHEINQHLTPNERKAMASFIARNGVPVKPKPKLKAKKKKKSLSKRG